MKPFVFPNNEISEASCSHPLFVPQKAWPSFLHTFLLENEVQTSGKKKYRAVIFYEIGDHIQNSAHLDVKKKNLTKIRHRMVMLRHLQLFTFNHRLHEFGTKEFIVTGCIDDTKLG